MRPVDELNIIRLLPPRHALPGVNVPPRKQCFVYFHNIQYLCFCFFVRVYVKENTQRGRQALCYGARAYDPTVVYCPEMNSDKKF